MPVTDKTRFLDIMEEIKELAEEAAGLCTGHASQVASAYWVPGLVTAVDEDHGYLGGCGMTMQDSLNSEEDEEDEEE